jgi:hypothetical protein
MAEINYGVSDAARAEQAVQAYGTASAEGIANMEQQYKDKVNELASAIVSGMSPQEKSVLEKQVQDLGNRYSQAIAATQGQFAFAQQQAATVANEAQRQFEELAARQRAQSTQAVGGVTTRFTPGMVTAAQEDAIAAARDQAAAGAEYNIGMQGVAGTARSLYAQALEAQKAASRAGLEGSRVNLRTALEARALQAASEREQKERDRLREFELTGFNALLAAKADRDNKMAELLAAAASADTRSGKEKALAEFELFKKQENLKLQNDLKRIGAKAKASGSTQVSQAVSNLEAEVKGSQSGFGTVFDKTIASRPQGRPTTIKVQNSNGKIVDMPFDQAIAQGKLTKQYSLAGVNGAFYMSGNSLVWEKDPLDPAKTELIPLARLNTILKIAAGYMQTNKLTGAKGAAWLNQNVIPSLTTQDMLAIRYLFGTEDTGVLASILSSTRTPTIASVQPPKPAGATAKISYSGYGVPSTTTTPKPTNTKSTPSPAPKPTPKK